MSTPFCGLAQAFKRSLCCLLRLSASWPPQAQPLQLHNLPVLKRIAYQVSGKTTIGVVAGACWSGTMLGMANTSSYDHVPLHLHHDAPPYTMPEIASYGSLFNCANA